jgi:hypothetical protein
MTVRRAARLEALGFAWARPKGGVYGLPNEAAWEAQLARLAAYKAEHGDCNEEGTAPARPEKAARLERPAVEGQEYHAGKSGMAAILLSKAGVVLYNTII